MVPVIIVAKKYQVFFGKIRIKMKYREMAVSGSFYPNDEKEIKRYIEHFNKCFNIKGELSITPRALIVPHAGYIYSGFTANLAYNITSVQKFKRVIVIGPSHKLSFNGASVALYDEYQTPLGNIKIDLEYSKKLIEENEFLGFASEVHCEHSTETQAPFIKNYFDSLPLIEIVYGKLDYKKLSILIDELLKDKNNLIVISTDLSHFYNLDEAKKLDKICLEAIEKKDMKKFDEGCKACGMIGVKAIINSAIKNNLITKVLYYCTSYDTTKDYKKVVGYTSVLIGE